MLYPQYFIDDLKNRADLVRIIEPYAQLKKKGANWMGCCPFHEEKTPSFSVSPSKGFYKCFGCGKGGSVYNFLMEVEGLNFPEAVKRVAEMSGVPLPEPVDDKQYEHTKKKRQEKKKVSEEIVALNRTALEFWEAELHKKNAKAKAAREYLASRGIPPETQKTFHIGFAPDSWDSLLNLLKESGASEQLIEQSGLVSVNEEKNRVFDRFRGRIMFPVLDVFGNPVAFGARAMGDDQPKYLNSPETPAYIKGEHLYGLFQGKDEIRKKKFAILVEGYLDLIALYQAGITNVAASLGTAFTPEQSKLLSRFTKKVVINYDGDAAGIKAARRAVEVMLPDDFEIKVLVLPDGKDPDDFVREFGMEEYNQARGRALPFTRFILNSALHGRKLSTAKQQATAAEELLPFVRSVRNDTERRLFFDEVMRECHIEDSFLQKRLWELVRKPGSTDRHEVKKAVLSALAKKPTFAEQKLLELLVFDAELRGLIMPQLEESDYENLATESVFRGLMEIDRLGKPVTVQNLLEVIADEAAHDFVPLIMMGEPARQPGEVIDEVLHEAENCVFALRLIAISDRIAENARQMVSADQTGDFKLAAELWKEQEELGRIRLELQSQIKEI